MPGPVAGDREQAVAAERHHDRPGSRVPQLARRARGGGPARQPAAHRVLEFGEVRLDDRRARGRAVPQHRAPGIQYHRHCRGRRPRGQPGVGVLGQSRRQAPGQHYRVTAGQGIVIQNEKLVVLTDRYGRPGLVEQRGVVVARVHHGERAPGLPGDRGEPAGYPGSRQPGPDRLAGDPARQPDDQHLAAQGVQGPRHVECLAARCHGDLPRPVHPGPVHPGHVVGHVQGRVEADREDHGRRGIRACPMGHPACCDGIDPRDTP